MQILPHKFIVDVKLADVLDKCRGLYKRVGQFYKLKMKFNGI